MRDAWRKIPHQESSLPADNPSEKSAGTTFFGEDALVVVGSLIN
jgi:hypothetical protein